MILAQAVGSDLHVKPAWGPAEITRCDSETDAKQRAGIITEAVSWLGTPFRDCADIKGGGVDCAMLFVRCYVASGRLPEFDPRPYPPTWHVHQDRQRFLEGMVDWLGAKEIARPRPGDVCLYQFGRCFSHAAIIISSDRIIHAFKRDGFVTLGELNDSQLTHLATGKPRPIKYLEITGEGAWI